MPVSAIYCDVCGDTIVHGAVMWVCGACEEDYCDVCRSPAALAPAATAVAPAVETPKATAPMATAGGRHESMQSTPQSGRCPPCVPASGVGRTTQVRHVAARTPVGERARRDSVTRTQAAGSPGDHETAGGSRQRKAAGQGATVGENTQDSGQPSTTSSSMRAATTTALPRALARGQRGRQGTTRTTMTTEHHGEAAEEGVREILGDRADG